MWYAVTVTGMDVSSPNNIDSLKVISVDILAHPDALVPVVLKTMLDF